MSELYNHKQSISSLNKRVDHIEQKVEQIDRNVFEILTLLKGGPSKLSTGLVDTVEDLDVRVESLEQVKSKGAAIITGAISMGALGGIFSQKFLDVLKRIFIS